MTIRRREFLKGSALLASSSLLGAPILARGVQAGAAEKGVRASSGPELKRLPCRILWNWDCRTGWASPGGAAILGSAEAYLANFKRLIDFMGAHDLNGLIIWGFLRASHGGIDAAGKLCEYANARNVRIIPGVGVNSYGGFWYTGEREFALDDWLKKHPKLQAVGKDGKPVYWQWPRGIDPSLHTNACPSKMETQEWYLRGVKWLFDTLPIGGINFETGDIGIICHCQDCRNKRADKRTHGTSWADMRSVLPPLIEAARKAAPNNWTIYSTYRIWDNSFADFARIMPRYAFAMWNTPPMADVDDVEILKRRTKPPVEHNLVYPSFAKGRKPAYRQIADLCKRMAEMGQDGLVIYGENSHPLRYLALQEFSNDPAASVEAFEKKHRALL